MDTSRPGVFENMIFYCQRNSPGASVNGIPLKDFLNNSRGIQENIPVIREHKVIDFTARSEDSEVARLILTKYFPHGFHPKINLDYIRFRNYAEAEGLSLPSGNEELKRIIESEGTYLDGSIFIVSKELIDTIARLISDIQDTKAEVIFYAPLMKELEDVLTQNHIISLEMFRDLLQNKFEIKFFYSKDSFTFSDMTQDRAVLTDILRVWGSKNALFPHEISAGLPYIPEKYITECLKSEPDFERTAEGRYFLMKNFYVTDRERAEIYRFVENSCRSDGFAAIMNIPCESVKENNSDLTGDGLYTAIFNTVLKGKFFRKHKIITDSEEGPNIVKIFRDYCRNMDKCTVSELNELSKELTGSAYPLGVFNALYDCMIRVSRENFASDYNVAFDIDEIDRAISLFMAERKYIPIKGITSFAAFPDCGCKWNHYILESFCYRFSRKYELRFYVEVSKNLLRFNNSNTGMIAEKNLAMSYSGMLAEILSRQKFELTEENAGQYFHDNGYVGKSKFTGLHDILKLAERIREGAKHVLIHS